MSNIKLYSAVICAEKSRFGILDRKMVYAPLTVWAEEGKDDELENNLMAICLEAYPSTHDFHNHSIGLTMIPDELISMAQTEKDDLGTEK